MSNTHDAELVLVPLRQAIYTAFLFNVKIISGCFLKITQTK